MRRASASRGVMMRLYLLNTATMAGEIPVPCYLVRTDDGRTILIDTGFSPAQFAASQQPGYAGLPISNYISIVDRLAALGIGADDVHTLVATHLDTDHAGMTGAFPRAEIVIQRAQYAAAQSGEHPRFDSTRAAWGAPGLRVRLVDGDAEVLPGVRVIETSGHVPGHQSVLIALPETGPVLLAIDAINIAAQADPDTGQRGPFDDDPERGRASVRKLRDLVAREDVALTVYGHDSAQWRTLKQAPEYYE